MKRKPSAKAVIGNVFSSIFIFFAIITMFAGSWIKVDSQESAQEVQQIFYDLKDKAEVVAEYQKVFDEAKMDFIIKGLGNLPIKRFTKTMNKMAATFDNRGVSTVEMIYPFAMNLILPLDRMSVTDAYTPEDRHKFFEIEGFIIAIVVGLILTLVVDILAFFLKVFNKTGFFTVAAAVLHFALLVMMIILVLVLTGYMEIRYSDVIFSITSRPVLGFLCAFIASVFATILRDKRFSKKELALEAEPVEAEAVPEVKPVAKAEPAPEVKPVVEAEPVAKAEASIIEGELAEVPTVEGELAKNNDIAN